MKPNFSVQPDFKTWWDANFRKLTHYALYSKATAVWNAAVASRDVLIPTPKIDTSARCIDVVSVLPGMLDLDKLEALAHDAGGARFETEGFEQIYGNGSFYGGLIMHEDGETIVASCVLSPWAEFIAAANPATILELIAKIRVSATTNAQPPLTAGMAAPDAHIATLKKHWTGVYWNGVSHSDRDAINEAFSVLAAAPVPQVQPSDAPDAARLESVVRRAMGSTHIETGRRGEFDRLVTDIVAAILADQQADKPAEGK